MKSFDPKYGVDQLSYRLGLKMRGRKAYPMFEPFLAAAPSSPFFWMTNGGCCVCVPGQTCVSSPHRYSLSDSKRCRTPTTRIHA